MWVPISSKNKVACCERKNIKLPILKSNQPKKNKKKKQTNWCHVLMVKNTIIMEQIIGVKAFCVHTHTHTHTHIYIYIY